MRSYSSAASLAPKSLEWCSSPSPCRRDRPTWRWGCRCCRGAAGPWRQPSGTARWRSSRRTGSASHPSRPAVAAAASPSTPPAGLFAPRAIDINEYQIISQPRWSAFLVAFTDSLRSLAAFNRRWKHRSRLASAHGPIPDQAIANRSSTMLSVPIKWRPWKSFWILLNLK